MTDQSQEYLTREKFEELERELEYLKTTRRTEIAEQLEYARSLGDLSENAEYHEAREQQAATEERIRKIEEILKNAEIVSRGDTTAVELGATVTVQKEGDDKTHTYQVVGSEEADMQQRKISHMSPLGEAMMGKSEGETFTFTTPSGGKMSYKILKVE